MHSRRIIIKKPYILSFRNAFNGYHKLHLQDFQKNKNVFIKNLLDFLLLNIILGFMQTSLCSKDLASYIIEFLNLKSTVLSFFILRGRLKGHLGNFQSEKKCEIFHNFYQKFSGVSTCATRKKIFVPVTMSARKQKMGRYVFLKIINIKNILNFQHISTTKILFFQNISAFDEKNQSKSKFVL